ncbi:hypothetical protein PV04_10196 [Phialophora macrospora]|uniref:Uncharacterized protein n=1 Tax=Phialophora macrospora TaxID=1851006 RepID=A0A0D2F5Z8_9EURO|nr:hypothetical protein PV04_10196 [Phialophora macrospora]
MPQRPGAGRNGFWEATRSRQHTVIARKNLSLWVTPRSRIMAARGQAWKLLREVENSVCPDFSFFATCYSRLLRRGLAFGPDRCGDVVRAPIDGIRRISRWCRPEGGWSGLHVNEEAKVRATYSDGRRQAHPAVFHFELHASEGLAARSAAQGCFL